VCLGHIDWQFLFVLDFNFFVLLDILLCTSIGLWCLDMCAALTDKRDCSISCVSPSPQFCTPSRQAGSPFSCRTFLTQLIVCPTLKHPVFRGSQHLIIPGLLSTSTGLLHLRDCAAACQHVAAELAVIRPQDHSNVICHEWDLP
jgi:hypothetical protein